MSCLGQFGQEPRSEVTHPWQLLKSELQQLGNLGAGLAACLESRGNFYVYIPLLWESGALLSSVLPHCHVPTSKGSKKDWGKRWNKRLCRKPPWRVIRYHSSLHPYSSSPTTVSNNIWTLNSPSIFRQEETGKTRRKKPKNLTVRARCVHVCVSAL